MKSWNGCNLFYDIIIVIIILVMPVSPWCPLPGGGWRPEWRGGGGGGQPSYSPPSVSPELSPPPGSPTIVTRDT